MISTPPSSLNLLRHGDSQRVIQFAFLAMAIGFWIRAVTTDHPVMDVRTYGEWALHFSAESWAASLMLASGFHLLGIFINGSWRWSPLLRVIGSTWHVMTLLTFGASSVTASHGDPVTIFAIVFGTVHVWFTWLNLGDLRRAANEVRS